MVVEVIPTASVIVAGAVAEVRSGNAKLDAGAVPYGVADLEVALSDGGIDGEDIDPRQSIRALLTAGDENGAQRTFDLSVRSRTVDHKAKTMRIALATDEAVLQQLSTLTTDIGAFAHQESVRAVVNYVLEKTGASLTTAGPDRSFRIYTDANNLIPDPRATSIDTYPVTNAQRRLDGAWPVTVDGVPHNSINIFSPTSADSYVSPGGDLGGMRLGMQAGRTYVFSATGSPRSGIGGAEARSRRLVAFYRIGGTYVTAMSPQVPATINGEARVSVEFSIPEGATEAFLRAYLGGTGGAMAWSQMRLSEKDARPGVDNTVYLWGGKPSTSEYLYSWEGTPDASRSSRRALIDRAPEILIWEPGDTAWEFLAPITASVGLRLFCDEKRVWRLIDPNDYHLEGVVTAASFNSTEGSDTVTADNAEVYCTGVVVRFRWRDNAGNNREATDAAGTPGSVLTIELNRPYAPGLASAILTRRQGQGRTQEVTALADWTASPSMQAAVSLPGTVDQIGSVTAVEWGLSNGLMRLDTRGLTEAPEGTWIGWSPTATWTTTSDALTWEGA